MSRHAKMLSTVLSGASDQTVRFDDLCALLARLGFAERRSSGSHRIFFHRATPEILNLQPRSDGTAKPYQVRQVRGLILRYHLALAPTPEASDER